jgi:hypothetical protein
MFHYCRLEAFKGIIESRKLWASDTRFLNDRQELLYAQRALRVSQDIILNRLRAIGHDDVFGRILTRAARENFKLFVTSFSQFPNKLSQWRSYANGGKGISIGLSPDVFERKGYLVKKVTYGDIMLDEIIQKLTELTRLKGGAPDFEKECYRTMIEWIACAKQVAFAEEDEVRVSIFTHQFDPADIRYRTVGDLIVPYVEIDLSTDWPSAITHVWLGPMNSDPMAKEVLQDFLNAHGLYSTLVSTSNTALR